jgi:hypothetical protein
MLHTCRSSLLQHGPPNNSAQHMTCTAHNAGAPSHGWLLLRDAVNVAAAQQHLPRVHLHSRQATGQCESMAPHARCSTTEQQLPESACAQFQGRLLLLLLLPPLPNTRMHV